MTAEAALDPTLTVEEKATNFETMQHIHTVGHYVNEIIHQLLERAENHDSSKLDSPEVEAFTEYTSKLKSSTYGSQEYNGFKEAMKPALEHHYAKNRHHPEHFPDGIADMTLIDLVEMFCDWKAATLRHHNGNLLKSIEINAERFKISPQLKQILENTAELFD
jgi:hypothetical protein